MVRAKLQNGSFTSDPKKLFGTSPLFFSLSLKSKSRAPRKRRAESGPKPVLESFFFDCRFGDELRSILYRPAVIEDLPNICKFVDFWLAGGALRLHIPGGGKDYFVPKGQQIGYLKYKTTYLAIYDGQIVGWSVKSKNETLIHLLVAPEYRGKGIGSHLLEILNPLLVRSKSDQSTGNPLRFYQKHGYEIAEAGQGKNKNIDILRHRENSPKNPVTPTTESNVALNEVKKEQI